MFEFLCGFVFTPVREFAGSGYLWVVTDSVGDFFGSPASDGVVVFEGEAEGIDFGVAGCAVGVVDVGFEFFAKGGFWAGGIGGDGVDIGRWRRRGFSEDGFAEPDATVDRAMADSIAGEGEDGGVREDAAAMCFGWQSDLNQIGGRGLLGGGLGCERLGEGGAEAVILREELVHHAPVGLDELAEGEAVVKHFAEKGLCFLDHAAFEAFVVVGIKFFVGLEHADFAEAQPLSGEGVRKPRRAWVGNHASELRGENRTVAKFSFLGEGEELPIGHGVPEKVGKTGGDFPVIEGLACALFVAFCEEKEAFGVEDGSHACFHRIAKRFLCIQLALNDFNVSIHLAGGDRTTECARCEPREGLAHLFHVAFVGGHVIRAEFDFFVREDGAFPSDGVEDQEGVAGLALLVGQLHLPGDASDFGADEGDGAVSA